MKMRNRVRRLRERQKVHEEILDRLKNDPVRAGGYKRPGSLNK